MDSVSFSVQRGEIVSLVGGPGSGNSVLTRMIAALILPSSGRISVAGRDTRSAAHFVKMSTTFIGEQHPLCEEMTARENVAFFVRLVDPHRVLSGDDICNALRHAGVTERALGQKGRDLPNPTRVLVWLAIAMLRGSAVVVADRPIAQASSRAIDDLRESLRLMAQTDRAIVLSTSDTLFAGNVSDRVMMIGLGRKTAEFSGSQLLHKRISELNSDFADKLAHDKS